MGVEFVGAPEFTIGGDAAVIRSCCNTMGVRSSSFQVLADSLEAISTDGWSGRAADRFRERFKVEPERWRQAADGFNRAAISLAVYADSLEAAQAVASQCRKDWEEANRTTETALALHDAEMGCQYRDVRGPLLLTGGTPEPFHDPGIALRNDAERRFDEAVTQVNQAGVACADEVRRACTGAPESRNWLESGVDFVGGVIGGATEGFLDLAKFGLFPAYSQIRDLWRVADGRLTMKEALRKESLIAEDAGAFFDAAREDPVGVGIEAGKAAVDWDSWADDQAGAIGKLVPDAAMAYATAGMSGAVRARRASKAWTRLVSRAERAGARGGERIIGGQVHIDLSVRKVKKGADLVDSSPVLGVDENGRALTTMEEWQSHYRTGPKEFDFAWPKKPAVPGSEVTTSAAEYIAEHGTSLDRVGKRSGTWFARVVDGNAPSFQSRAIPAESLNQPYSRLEFNVDKLDGLTITSSKAAPAFGYSGGATQLQVIDVNGKTMSLARMLKEGIVREVR